MEALEFSGEFEEACKMMDDRDKTPSKQTETPQNERTCRKMPSSNEERVPANERLSFFGSA